MTVNRTTVAVLGTGLLGSGIAENLVGKGHDVRVWNRSRDKLAPLVQKGAKAAQDPAAAARGAARVHLVLAEDDVVDVVVKALQPGLGKDAWLIDHSTNLPARVAARFARLRSSGVRYLHAPVFMSPQNAREASGMMVLSGPKADADVLTESLQQMTGRLWWCGERPDLAAFHKLAGNGLLIALTGAMGDLLAMGESCGLEPQQVLALFEVWKPGAAIPFFGQRVAAAGSGPPSFELAMARKDVRLMLETSGRPGRLCVLPAVAAAMDQAVAKGHGKADFAVFARTDAR
jgi:3-hydroxyisobutyrate dehydrogenase-like beta-hydroxyacid dehydrogenase